MDFARYCLREGMSLEILSWAGVSNHALSGETLQLPSWVPDWRLPFRSPSDKLRGITSDKRFDILGLDDSNTEFATIGKLIDRVIAFCPCLGFIEDHALAKGGEKWHPWKPGYVPIWYQALDELFIEVFRLMNVDVST